MLKKLINFLETKIVNKLAGTGDFSLGVVFSGFLQKYKNKRFFIFLELIYRNILTMKKTVYYKQFILFLEKIYSKLKNLFHLLKEIMILHYQKKAGDFIAWSFLYIIINLFKSLYYEIIISIYDNFKLNELMYIISIKIRTFIFFNTADEIKKTYASNTLIKSVPSLRGMRLKVLKWYFILYHAYMRTNTIPINTATFFRPINFSAYWSSCLNWFNIFVTKMNVFLILIDFILMVLACYFLGFLWINYYYFFAHHLEFIWSFLYNFLFCYSGPLIDINAIYVLREDLETYISQPIQYYNFSYLNETEIASKSFSHVCEHILLNNTLYMKQYLVLLYLLHSLFFLISFNQLRNILLLYSQMYLESTFQVPLFFQITTLYNLNPYETRYFQIFLNYIILKQPKKLQKHKVKRVTFQLVNTIKTDLFTHPRYYLKYQTGQLLLIRYTQYLFIKSSFFCIGFSIIFYFMPLLTCLSLWSFVLFSQWFLLQNLTYADFSYLDLIRPKLQMLNYYRNDIGKFSNLADLQPVYFNFYKNYLYKKVQQIKKFCFYPHKLDQQFWINTNETYWKIYMPTKINLEYIFKLKHYFFVDRKFQLFVINIFLLCFIIICRSCIRIFQITNVFFFVRVRRKIKCYLNWVSAENILKFNEEFLRKVQTLIFKHGINGLIWILILGLMKLFIQYFIFVCIEKIYFFFHLIKNLYLTRNLQKECNFYFSRNRSKAQKNALSKIQEWIWHTNIVEDYKGTFYKITKIDKEKIYGVEVKFLEAEFEKGYYYGRRIFNWEYTKFLDTFPLFEWKIFWFEFYVSKEAKIIRQYRKKLLEIWEEMLIRMDKLERRTDLEKFLDSVLDIHIFWHLRALYLYYLTDESEAHEVLESDIPLHAEFRIVEDILGPETFHDWDLSSKAIEKLGEDVYDENTGLEHKYFYRIYENSELYLSLDQKEFCDFFDFYNSDEDFEEIEFDRHHELEYERGISLSDEDLEEGELESKDMPRFLVHHEEEDEWHDEDYFEYSGEIYGGEDFIEEEGAPDDELDCFGQVKQTVDYWSYFYSIIIAHFFVCLCSIITFILYCCIHDQKQIFFFFFDIADFFYFDFVYWTLGNSSRGEVSTIYMFTVNEYLEFISPQIDNIFGTGNTNFYGYLIQQVLDQTIELQIWTKGTDIGWGDLFTEQLPFHAQHYNVLMWEPERYFRQRRFRKKFEFLYKDIGRLYYYLYYFSVITNLITFITMSEKFVYNILFLCFSSYNELSIFVLVTVYVTYFSPLLQPGYFIFIVFYLFVVNKLLKEIFKDSYK